MKSYAKMYRVWTTKHVSGLCVINKLMSYWKPGWSAICPSCGEAIESSAHITRCKDKGRRKMLQSSVQELVDWMYESTEDEEMTTIVSTYLMEQGESTLEETADEAWTTWCREDETDSYKNLIEETDRLGWDCLVT